MHDSENDDELYEYYDNIQRENHTYLMASLFMSMDDSKNFPLEINASASASVSEFASTTSIYDILSNKYGDQTDVLFKLNPRNPKASLLSDLVNGDKYCLHIVLQAKMEDGTIQSKQVMLYVQVDYITEIDDDIEIRCHPLNNEMNKEFKYYVDHFGLKIIIRDNLAYVVCSDVIFMFDPDVDEEFDLNGISNFNHEEAGKNIKVTLFLRKLHSGIKKHLTNMNEFWNHFFRSDSFDSDNDTKIVERIKHSGQNMITKIAQYLYADFRFQRLLPLPIRLPQQLQLRLPSHLQNLALQKIPVQNTMTQDDEQLQKKILNILQNMMIDFSHSKIINTNSINFRELLDLLKVDEETLLQIIQDNVLQLLKPIKHKPSHATIEEMGVDEQLKKYLKYKAKYLSLKKNL